MNNKVGILYIVGTPIGNLEDITLRGLKTLKSVDLIACEDTRHTQKLLNHFSISTKSESYHKFNEKSKCSRFINLLESGKDVALVSDSGMPGISDPGNILIKEVIKNNVSVIPVPGPSACITALVASGFDIDSFIYEGFLPQKKMAKKKKLMEFEHEVRPVVFYESPKRILETLKAVEEVLGDREVVIAREITKFYEEYIRGKASDVLKKLGASEVKGEIVLIIQGGIIEDEAPIDIEKEVTQTMKKLNITKKEAITFVAARYNIMKKDVYKKTIKNS